jgi:hypothetical protein
MMGHLEEKRAGNGLTAPLFKRNRIEVRTTD